MLVSIEPWTQTLKSCIKDNMKSCFNLISQGVKTFSHIRGGGRDSTHFVSPSFLKQWPPALEHYGNFGCSLQKFKNNYANKSFIGITTPSGKTMKNFRPPRNQANYLPLQSTHQMQFKDINFTEFEALHGRLWSFDWNIPFSGMSAL